MAHLEYVKVFDCSKTAALNSSPLFLQDDGAARWESTTEDHFPPQNDRNKDAAGLPVAGKH